MNKEVCVRYSAMETRHDGHPHCMPTVIFTFMVTPSVRLLSPKLYTHCHHH